MAEKEKTKVKDSNGTFGDLKTMVTDYAKQQTVEPLKHLGKWAAFGIGGGVMLIIGAFLSGLGVLRLFQKLSFLTKEENGISVDTTWTFLPYLFTGGILVVVVAVCVYAMTKTPEWMEDDA
jgi:hypothetical protein